MWDELKTRSVQAVRKRVELARYYAGVRPARIELNLSRSARGSFFFIREDLPTIVSGLRQHLPDQVDRIVESANDICAHQFRLLGYERVKYGSEIDWHLDAIHHKKAPFLPWFKIPFLDFAEVGDHKVVWELNRHQHLVTLAKAWALTHRDKYATEIISQWYSWHAANPYPMGINWASSLEVAFRSLSWLWVRHLLADCPAYENLDRDLLQALHLHAAHIENYISTYFSPNTHLLGEALTLFSIGTVCPQLSRAQRWQDKGYRILLNEAERQVRDDGTYFEQSIYYHVYALDFFLHFRQLAECNHILVPQNFDAILNKMLSALQALSQAGIPQSFGDDDGGRLFDSSRNHAEHLTDPLATGGLLLGRPDLKSDAALTEEAIWLFGPASARDLPAERSHSSASKPVVLNSAGLYISASPRRFLQQMVIDAGGMGSGRGGHGHADALSVTVSLNGRSWLVDPGTFCYAGPGNERNQFRGTSSHNTLLVDNLDQATPDGPFGWRAHPITQSELFVEGRRFSFFVGSHQGYCRLPNPVMHRRFVLHVYGQYWFVRDVIEGRGKHDLKIAWHFAPGIQLNPAPGAFVASHAEDDARSPARMALLFSENETWRQSAASYAVSPAYGIQERASVLVASAQASAPTECGTAIVPLTSKTDELGIVRRLMSAGEYQTPVLQAYEFTTPETTYLMFFSESQGGWSFGPFESDARFLCSSASNGDVVDLMMCDLTFAKIRGRNVFHHSKRTKHFERWKEAGSFRAFSSNSAELDSSSELFETCAL